MAQHNTGIASAYTACRLPVRLLWSQDHQTRDDAYWLERQLKGWSLTRKEAAMRGDWDALPELAQTARVRARPSTSSG